MEKKETQYVILSKDVANAIFNFLGSKPYTEVSEVINAMMNDINLNAKDLIISPKPVEKVSEPQPQVQAEVPQPKLEKAE